MELVPSMSLCGLNISFTITQGKMVKIAIKIEFPDSGRCSNGSGQAYNMSLKSSYMLWPLTIAVKCPI